MLKKVSLIGNMFVTTENMVKCLKCGEESDFTINDDVYVRLDKRCFVWKCPNCKTEHSIDLVIDLLEDK